MPDIGSPFQKRLRAFVDRYIAAIDAGANVSAVDALLTPIARTTRIPADTTGWAALLDRAEQMLDAAPTPPARLEAVPLGRPTPTGDTTHSPTLGSSPDGDLWAAWVDYRPGQGERVLASRRQTSGAWAEPICLTPAPADCVRPTLAGGSALWLLYGLNQGDGCSVRAHQYRDGRWQDAEAVSESVVQPALNQEAVADGHGVLHVVFQGNLDGRFAIFYRQRTEAGWQPAEQVSIPSANDWDPCVAADAHGTVWVLWASYRHGRYVLVGRRRPPEGIWEPEHVLIDEPGRYAIHPALAPALDGGIWLAYDSVSIPNHGGSGDTAYRPAEQMGVDRAFYPRNSYLIECEPRVSRFDGQTLWQTPGPLSSNGEPIAATMPRIAVDARGRPWVSFRDRRRMPFYQSYYDLAVTFFDGETWQPPVVLADSDGPPAEASLLASPDGICAAWHTDRRKERSRDLVQHFGGLQTPDSELLEHFGSAVWEPQAGVGEVVVARLLGQDSPNDLSWFSAGGEASHPRADLLASPPDDPILEVARPALQRDGATYTLRWGDLHRHSNISRCGTGLDFDLDDHFRFARDVCEYDFWAMTDHAEHTSEFGWWHIQKLCDLFHIPGVHVPMFGFEWTSFQDGHLNIIYPERGGPIFSAFDYRTDTPAKLWQALDGRRALTIPHHPAAIRYPTNWSYSHPEYLRIAEIFQAATGSYEGPGCFRQHFDAGAPGATIQEALNRGVRIGLIGSTDHRYGASYVGLYAEDLTREGLFAALRARRCFASTARGIVPSLTINGAWIGEEITASGPVQVHFSARGRTELSKVQVIRDGAAVFEHAPSPGLPEGRVRAPVDISWRSHEGEPHTWDGFLCVDGSARILPTRYYAPEVVRADDRQITWEARYVPRAPEGVGFPNHGGLGATIEGPADARIEIQAGPLRLSGRLGDLLDGGWEAEESQATLRVTPGTGGLTGLGVDRVEGVWTDPKPAGGSYYYLRVIQVDGEAAWSSPIWVDPA